MDHYNPLINTSTLPITVTTISTTSTASYVVCSFVFSSYEEMMTFKILKCYVNPILSIIGFSTNVISVHMLRHSGLKKPSNIFLLGLTVSDMMCQLMTMNYALILDYFGPNRMYLKSCGYQYGEAINYFLLGSLCVIYFLGQWGQYVSSVIPCIITLERFLAVFTPMTFRRVINIKTASVSVVAAYIIWLPFHLFYMYMFEVTSLYSRTGVHVLKLVASSRFYSFLEVFHLLNYYIGTALTSWAPIALVSLGCALIGVNVKLTLQKRKKLSSSSNKLQWSMRTTRTLVSTCIVFVATRALVSIILYAVTDVSPGGEKMCNEFLNTIYLINSSSNFFIYVASDKKMLLIFLNLFRRRKPQYSINI